MNKSLITFQLVKFFTDAEATQKILHFFFRFCCRTRELGFLNHLPVAATTMGLQRLLYLLSWLYSAQNVVSWPVSPQGDSRPSDSRLDRRVALANIGLGTASVVGGFFFNPQSVVAKEPMSTDSTTFETYTVIPDASESLNPTLLKVDVSVSSFS